MLRLRRVAALGPTRPAHQHSSTLEQRAANGELRTAVLLTPFDRPRAIKTTRRIEMVRTCAILDAISHLAADLQPADGLWSAAGAAIRLMPYQLAPSLAAVVHGVTRMLVADEVGLGKTIQAGLLLGELATRIGELRAIVLVPAGLRDQWRRELDSHFGLLAVDADANWLRTVSRDRPVDVNPWTLAGIYIASHDFVKRPDVLRPLEDVTWDLVVVDEAHAMGVGTDRRAAAHAVALRSRRVMLLTATPCWDDPRAFDALCDVGRVSADRTPIVLFHRLRSDVTPASHRRSVVLTISPSPAECRMHALLGQYTARVWAESRCRQDQAASLVAVVLRKRALSSAASLARSVRRRLDLLARPPAPESHQLSLPLTDEDPLDDDVPPAALAVPALSDVQQEREWLSAIERAADEASSVETKTRKLVRLLARLNEPVIVFTEYRDTLLGLHRAISATGRRVLVMHGGMNACDRAAVQREFNERDAVLLATDAASEGLNLHLRCRVLVHYELPWSPSRLEQRAGRVDRLGQTHRVHEIALVADDTAEQIVLAPLVRKAAVSRRTGAHVAMWRALSENRVAEAILEGKPPPRELLTQAPARASTAPSSLDDEATAEVRRLEQRRQWLARLDPHTAGVLDGRWPSIVVSPTRSGTLPSGLLLVYATTVSGPDSMQLHGALVVIHVAIVHGHRIYRHRSVLRRTLRSLAGSPPAPLRELLATACDRAQRTAASIHARVHAQMQQRESDMRNLYVSAAEQIVQAGLFDRRSLRSAAHRQRVRDSCLAAAACRAGVPGTDLEAETTLVAAVLVRPSKGMGA